MGTIRPAATHPSMPRVRPVPLEGAFNFRDVGGHAAGDRRVRTGLVYRSDALHVLTSADLARLRGLGIRTVVDLRSSAECDHFGRCDTTALPATYRHVPLLEQPWSSPAAGEPAARWLADRYAEVLSGSADKLVETLAVVADPGSWPVVFHCTGGKDRSGVVAAVLLGLLGVPDADIVDDYCRSTPGITWLRRHRLAAGIGDDVPAALFEVPAEAMWLFLDDVTETYGSIESWALHTAGMPPALLSALRTYLLA